jgi:hypothetical protein
MLQFGRNDSTLFDYNDISRNNRRMRNQHNPHFD